MAERRGGKRDEKPVDRRDDRYRKDAAHDQLRRRPDVEEKDRERQPAGNDGERGAEQGRSPQRRGPPGERRRGPIENKRIDSSIDCIAWVLT